MHDYCIILKNVFKQLKRMLGSEMGGGNRHPPKAGVQDEVRMRSRARGRLTEVPWRLAFSFVFSALPSPQDMLVS